MRYRIYVYKPDVYLELINFLQANNWNDLPEPEYLRDFGLLCRDNRTNRIVGFIYAIMGLSNTAYLAYIVTDKSVKLNKLRGNRVFYLLWKGMESGLKGAGKKKIIGFAEDYNDELQKLYIKHGGEQLYKGYFYKKIL
jgi:hypothetical protein